jgi:hypothetical protein
MLKLWLAKAECRYTSNSILIILENVATLLRVGHGPLGFTTHRIITSGLEKFDIFMFHVT